MKTVVIRHPKENRQKCSLRHLHERDDFVFFNANDGFSFDATNYTLLEINAPTMSEYDANRPILLLDSTWHLLPKIRAKVYGDFIPRSLPPSIKTAYPRVSKMHEDPNGLATIEALYVALKFAGRLDISVIRQYPFAQHFLEINGWQNDVPPNFFDGTKQILFNK